MTSKMYLVAALALAAAPCFASTIAVTNFSFETLPAGGLTTCGAGCAYDVGAIPGWSTTSGATSGQIQPNATQFPVLSDGITSAFSTTAGRSEEHTSELQSLRHLVCR